MNRILLCFCVIAMLTTMAGCSEPDTLKIGVSQCSQDDWRSKMNDEIRREIMFHENVEVEIRSADDDNAKQIADIRYFADNGFDIIIVSPNQAEALTPAIAEVHGRGIPVIIFDRNINGDTYTARIGVDDEGIGRSAAHYAFSLTGRNPRALEICGLPGATPAMGRHAGFKKEFEGAGGTILASVPANWKKENAVEVTDSLLRIYKDVELIFAHNDRMAIGAAETARRLGRDDIRIIGIDAAPSIGIQAVADSIIDATFLYPTEGHRIIRIALDILEGRPFSRETILPASSAVDLSNADILLLQNESLADETKKMEILKARIDDYWAKHSAQTMLFYASVAIIVLLVGVVFLVLRYYWQNKRHRAVLLEQNKLLEVQRDAQKALNHRLEEATQSKLMFFTNVSHDLRTPLTLIAEPVAQMVGAPNLTPRQSTLMRLADKNVRILRRLINQVLDFRKYENDRLALNLAETDLAAAMGEWMESFRALALKRGLALTVRIPDEPMPMAIDTDKMERVVFNLISNAFKYTPAGGSIDVSLAEAGGRAVIRVADTGRGISERDLGNIFDRFYQVDCVHPNGSGIGLSLTKAFVEMHSGTIAVESAPGRGSVFTVTLPVSHVDAGSADEPAPSAMNADEVEAELAVIDTPAEFAADKPVVLAIDDNSDIRQLLVTLLGDDYNVVTAADGAEGLRRAAKYVPDLVIADVMMPGVDGLECCRRLKAEVTTSHIPVLMLTACSMDEQRVQGYDSGADGYLSKPFSTAVLKARCASLIENRKRISSLWNAPASATAAERPESEPAREGDIDNEFYNRFLDIFNAEMGNSDISVDILASHMGLERTQFYRKIKSLTGYTPVELIRTLRLRRGRQLLITTARSVSEIAYEIGFSTPAYFTKCYREAFAETPSDTRAKSPSR